MIQTEQLLTEAFWQLLEEKPYKKITVRDIVDRCQVNRNTFYYHFEGIPSLLERAIQDWEERILSDPRLLGPPLLGILPIAEACMLHRRALLNLFHSSAKEEVFQFIEVLCRRVAETFIAAASAENSARKNEVKPLSEEDQRVMVRFYKAILSGCLLTWMNEDMKGDLSADIHRVLQILSLQDGR